jgi:hypothetical protein
MKIVVIFFLIFILIIALFSSSKIEAFNPMQSLVFYTGFYGTKSNPAFVIPKVPSEKYHCYYFTNNREMLVRLRATKWIGILDNQPETDDEIVSTMYSKRMKAVPEQFEVLNKYDYTCYLDSKLNVSESFVEKMIDTYFVRDQYALLIRRHTFLHSVREEFHESMKQDRYIKERDRYLQYIKKQIDSGLSEISGSHCQTGFIIRNMKHPNTRNIDSTWYDHIKDCGIECQISFPFIKQLFSKDIYVFSESPLLNE